MVVFPSTVYKNAWKTFRLKSNENENKVTAEVILSFPYWRNRSDEEIRLLDVGCGDGLFLQSFIQKLCCNFRYKIGHVTILDPYVDWLEEATTTLRYLNECGTIPELYKIDTGIEENMPNILISHSVIFAIHVVYLFKEGVFQNLIQSLPPKIRLYAVMDAPESVFSMIWRKTQPSYLKTVEKAHEFISSLGDEYSVCQESVISIVDNPLLIEDAGIKNLILSMLSYSNYELLSNEDIEYINQKVKENSQGSDLRCKSICYEIFKR